jgi:protein SSD1
MTNHQLQDIVDLDEQDSDAEIEKDIRVLYSISKLLHQKRQGKAISLKHPDIDITFRDNTPIYVAPKLNMECEVLLEEFQVLANTHVAQKICSHFPDHALLRSQSPPNERKLVSAIHIHKHVIHILILLYSAN